MKILILLLLPLIGVSQSVKKIKDQTLYHYDEYFVLRSNTQVKHGKYLRLTQYKKDTLFIGEYLNNKKHGEWKYFKNGKTIAEGSFENGERSKVWNFYENSLKYLSYDFESDSILFLQNDKKRLKISDEKEIMLDNPPLYPGFYADIYENMTYPRQALRMGIEGKVLVSFFVSENGKITNLKIEQDIGVGCGEELIRAIKSLPKNWISARINNKDVAIQLFVLSEFKLYDNGIKDFTLKIL